MALSPHPADGGFFPRGFSLRPRIAVRDNYLTAFFYFYVTAFFPFGSACWIQHQIPVSLFDLENRLFAPTHGCWKLARGGCQLAIGCAGLTVYGVQAVP